MPLHILYTHSYIYEVQGLEILFMTRVFIFCKHQEFWKNTSLVHKWKV